MKAQDCKPVHGWRETISDKLLAWKVISQVNDMSIKYMGGQNNQIIIACSVICLYW